MEGDGKLGRIISFLREHVDQLYALFVKQSKYVQALIVTLVLIFATYGGWITWAILRSIDFFIAQKFVVDEILLVLPVNRGFANALFYVVLFIIAPISWAILSRDKERRARAFSNAVLFSALLFLFTGFLSRNFLIDPHNPQHAINCFVMDKGKPKLIPLVEGNEFQFDPETGKKCVPVTPEVAVRLNQPQPKKLELDSSPVFFDSNLGTVKIYYSRNTDNSLQLFDGEGFDPDTGQPLLPVTKEIVTEWKKIKANWLQQKEFERVEAERQIKLEEDRKAKAEIDRKALERAEADRKAKAESDIKAQEQAESDRKAKFEAERIAQQEAEADRKAKLEAERIAFEQSEADRKAKLEAENEAVAQAELIKKAKEEFDARALATAQEVERRRLIELAGNDCDRLAGNQYDQQRNRTFSPVDHDILVNNSSTAVAACREAIEQSPQTLRYQYQLARSLQTNAPDEAYPILVKLANNDYAAACDNLGWLLIRKNKKSMGIEVFESGTNLGCIECMFSLGSLLYQGRHTPQNRNAGFEYLQKAANAGHAEAEELVQSYSSEMQANQRTQEMVGDLVGQVFKKILAPK